MAIIKDGKREFEGRVLCEHSRYWMDGMEEVWAIVWDMEAHKTKSITVGYYGIDGCNLAGCSWDIDASDEVIRDVIRTLKNNACEAFCRSVLEAKAKISKGTHAEVIRGRKVPKGTKLEIFWVGERETYRSKQYHWMHEYEEVAGAYDEDGNKIWIKTEYLKNIDPIKSPCAAERKKFIKAYVKRTARELYNIQVR